LEILLLAVGRLKAGPERELSERYLERARKLGRRLGLKGFAVEEIPESRAGRSDDRIGAEAEALIARRARLDRLVCLHSSGETPDSATFAAWLAKDAAASVPRTVFLIGGPDGLGRAVLDRSDRQVSFGRLTWPHQLARILLAEQLYRATTILSGHPYHRE